MTQKTITSLSYEIVGLAIKVHKQVGPGLLESVYESCLEHELKANGFIVKRQIKIPFLYDEIQLDLNLKPDLYVEDCIVVELKTVEHILPVHSAQLLTYMKLLKAPQGLLINFYTDNITRSMRPLVNEYFNDLPIG